MLFYNKIREKASESFLFDRDIKVIIASAIIGTFVGFLSFFVLMIIVGCGYSDDVNNKDMSKFKDVGLSVNENKMVLMSDNFSLFHVYSPIDRPNTVREMYSNTVNKNIYLFMDKFNGYNRPYCWWLYDSSTDYSEGFCDVNNDNMYEEHFSSNKSVKENYNFEKYWSVLVK